MRTSSKILAILFLLVAGGLFLWVTKMDDAEIQTAIEERVGPVTADRERALEEAFGERQRALEQSLADTLARREQAIRERLAELDSVMAGVDAPVYYRLDADTVEQVLRHMGLAFERGVDDSNDPKFSFKLATYSVTLYFYGCEEAGCTSLRIYAGFTMDEPPPQERINEWNRSKRYATAYIRDNGGIGLDNDLIVNGGITLGAVEEFLVNFRNRLNEFATHIGF